MSCFRQRCIQLISAGTATVSGVCGGRSVTFILLCSEILCIRWESKGTLLLLWQFLHFLLLNVILPWFDISNMYSALGGGHNTWPEPHACTRLQHFKLQQKRHTGSVGAAGIWRSPLVFVILVKVRLFKARGVPGLTCMGKMENMTMTEGSVTTCEGCKQTENKHPFITSLLCYSVPTHQWIFIQLGLICQCESTRSYKHHQQQCSHFTVTQTNKAMYIVVHVWLKRQMFMTTL